MKTIFILIFISFMLGCKKESVEMKPEQTFCFDSKYFIPLDSMRNLSQYGVLSYLGKVSCPDTMRYAYKAVIVKIIGVPFKIKTDTVYMLSKDTVNFITSNYPNPFIFSTEKI